MSPAMLYHAMLCILQYLVLCLPSPSVPITSVAPARPDEEKKSREKPYSVDMALKLVGV